MSTFTGLAFLIKSIFERRHLKWLLLSRFLTFMEKIEKSKKPILRVLTESNDRGVICRTKENTRKIIILDGKSDITKVTHTDVDKNSTFHTACLS